MPLKRTVLAGVVAFGLVAHSFVDRVNAEVLHTFGSSLGQEVTSLIAVSRSKLAPLVPSEYTIVPASSLLLGTPDQGILAIVNYRGTNPVVDGRLSSNQPWVVIDVGILIVEPAAAASVGVNFPGAYHFYTVSIHTNVALYHASLRNAQMPVEHVENITYQRDMDDATGSGNLFVSIPAKHPFLYSMHTGFGYALAPGALNAAFWHNGPRGTSVLNFTDQPFRQGNALSNIYTRPGSSLNALLDGGGLGPCTTDPQTGFNCIIAPSLNLRYDQGSIGKLQLIKK